MQARGFGTRILSAARQPETCTLVVLSGGVLAGALLRFHSLPVELWTAAFVLGAIFGCRKEGEESSNRSCDQCSAGASNSPNPLWDQLCRGCPPGKEGLTGCEAFSALWEQSQDGLRLTDESGRIVAVNEAYCLMAGVQREELIGRPFACVYPAEQRQHVMIRYLEEFRRGGPRRTVERAWHRPDGTRIWIEGRVAPIRLRDHTFVLAAFRDITERKRLELELESKLAEARAFLGSTSVGLAMLARDGTFRRVNESFGGMLGASRSQLEGRKFEDWLEVESAYPILPGAALEGTVLPGSAMICRPRKWRDERTLFVELSPVTGPDGTMTAQALVAIDTTHLRQLEFDLELGSRIDAALLDAIESLVKPDVPPEAWEERVREVLRALALAFETERACWYVYDTAAGLCRLVLEWEDDEVDTSSLPRTEMPLEATKAWAAKLERSGCVLVEDSSRIEDAEHRAWFERRGIQSLVAVPVMDSAGQCTGWLALHAVRRKRTFGLRTVSRLRAAARAIAAVQELQRARWRLEQTEGRLRTALAQAERERDEAERARRAKSEFLGMVSHEIRTPLNGVLGVLGLLATSGTLTAEAAQLVEAAEDSAKALLSLLGDLIELARLESGAAAPQAHEFSPLELAEEALSAVAAAAADKRLVLASRIDNRLPERTRADVARLKQILLNLLGNAVKFTRHGGVLLHVAPERTGDRYAVVFAVEDTGIGIGEDEQQRVFESFYRGRRTPGANQGWGLGLAICQRLAAMMGGQIRLRSRPGGGSIFSLVLPVEADPKARREPRQPLAGWRILLLDDNQFRAGAFAAQLIGWGAELSRHLESGPAADAALVSTEWLAQQHNPDQVIRSLRACARKLALMKPAWQVGAGNPWQDSWPEAACFLEPLRWRDVLGWLRPEQARRESSGNDPSCIGLPPAGSRRRKVLVVDDNALNRRVVGAMLERLGCEVQTAKDGLEALATIEHDRPDLVLLDLEMPVLDGEQTARRIRQMGCDNLPILALSAHVLPEEVERAIKAGMQGFLPKPVGIADLEDALRQWGIGVDGQRKP